MAITPSRYTTGSHAPTLKTDPGAGAWKSTPESLGMKALKEVLLSAPAGALASHFGGADAVRHVQHYLGNSGGTLTVDFERLVREVSIAAQALQSQIDAAKAYVETLPAGSHSFTSTTGSLNHYITKAQSVNWFFAVGSYTTWGQGTATVPNPHLLRVGQELKIPR